MASCWDCEEDNADCCFQSCSRKGKRVTCDVRPCFTAYDAINDSDGDFEHGAFWKLQYDDNDERKLWSEQITQRGKTLEYFLQEGRREEVEFNKESLFTASMALPMVAWSSGQYWGPGVGFCRCSCDWDCTDLHIAGWLMRGLMFACLWLQWWLLDALHASRVKFPALDGVPYLCTYGQDTGSSAPPPRGPTGIVFDKHRGNIEPNYYNVMMRNGLAKALDALNMTNPDIGPVDYGMESASCRLACVMILFMWVLKMLLFEATTLNFLVGVPKLLFNPLDGYSEHFHFWEHCCPCKDDVDWKWHFSCYQWCNIWLPPAMFVGCVPLLFLSLKMSLQDDINNMHEIMLLLLAYWLITTTILQGLFAIRAPHARYSWIRPEEETEDCVRSLENAVFLAAQSVAIRASHASSAEIRLEEEKEDYVKSLEKAVFLAAKSDDKFRGGEAWQDVRKHLKKELWSLLGRKNIAKVKFDPNSLPYHYFWCEVLPFFTLRLFVMLMVARQGILILMNTGSIMELILNSLAISFVLELEKLLYNLFAINHIRDVMTNLQPFKKVLVADCVLSCFPQKKEEKEPDSRTLMVSSDPTFSSRSVSSEREEETDCRACCENVLNCFHLRPSKWEAHKAKSRIAQVPLFRKGDTLKRSDDYKKGESCCWRADPGVREFAYWEKVNGVNEEVTADFQTVWTIEEIAVEHAATGRVSGSLKRRRCLDTNEYKVSFENVKVDEFAKTYKLEMRDGWETWACVDEGSKKDHNGCNHRCCKMHTRFLSYMWPVPVFGIAMFGVHFFYFTYHCENQVMPFTFTDFGKPYFEGDIRLFGGWMSILGSWISQTVKYNDVSYCVPYQGSDMAGHERNASLCGITEVPTKWPWQ